MESQNCKPSRKKGPARRDFLPIKVRCFPDEKAAIEKNAKRAKLSCSSFLRILAVNAKIKPVVDPEIGRQIIRCGNKFTDEGRFLKMLIDTYQRNWVSREGFQNHLEKSLNNLSDAVVEMKDLLKQQEDQRQPDK